MRPVSHRQIAERVLISPLTMEIKIPALSQKTRQERGTLED